MESHALEFVHKPYESGIGHSVYFQYVLENGFSVGIGDRWSTDAKDLDHLDAAMRVYDRNGREHRAFIRRELSAGWVILEGQRARVTVNGDTKDDADALLADLHAALPRMVVGEEPRVPVTFWSLSPHGPRTMQRKIDVPAWLDIEDNYTPGVRRGLEHLVSDEFKPAFGGQLILWHGNPGTGKTWALRALASEWRKWCALHYITDPETFFGGQAHYMLEVLLSDYDEDDDKWRLLVLEDTGELLSADAKERAGQGLSRLLNVVDGLIGQGLRIMILVTTNEKIRNLHAAVARPGRCAALVEFEPFDRTEAREWLSAHGVDNAEHGGGPVSDLYAVVNGWRQGQSSSLSTGFGR